MESDGESDGKTHRKRRRAYSDYEAGKLSEDEEICLALALSLADQEKSERPNKKTGRTRTKTKRGKTLLRLQAIYSQRNQVDRSRLSTCCLYP